MILLAYRDTRLGDSKIGHLVGVGIPLKRQGTGALRDASRTREPWPSRQRLGV